MFFCFLGEWIPQLASRSWKLFFFLFFNGTCPPPCRITSGSSKITCCINEQPNPPHPPYIYIYIKLTKQTKPQGIERSHICLQEQRFFLSLEEIWSILFGVFIVSGIAWRSTHARTHGRTHTTARRKPVSYEQLLALIHGGTLRSTWCVHTRSAPPLPWKSRIIFIFLYRIIYIYRITVYR